MNKNTVFFTHDIALIALFFLGNGIIVFPTKSANQYSFFAFLISFVTTFLVALLFVPILKYVFLDCQKKSRLKTSFKIILTIALTLFATFVLADTLKDFFVFAQKILLPNSNKALCVVLFLFSVFYFSLKRQEDILKFCLLSFWGILILEIIFLAFSAQNFEFKNIIIRDLPNLASLKEQTMPYIKKQTAPILLVCAYQVLCFEKSRKKATACGILAGGLLLGGAILNTLLIFGSSFSAKLDFPYSHAVSTVSLGRLFSRLDGFSYFIYFASCLIKSVVCVFVIRSFLKLLAKKEEGQSPLLRN